MLERVHRSAPTKNPAKVGRRDIYAAIHEWDDAEYLTRSFRTLNRKNRNLKLYLNYKYGPMTTRRRNYALKIRRRLLEENKIVQGFISFPAKLMVKTSADAQWEVLDDYSHFALADLDEDGNGLSR